MTCLAGKYALPPDANGKVKKLLYSYTNAVDTKFGLLGAYQGNEFPFAPPAPATVWADDQVRASARALRAAV